MKRFALVLSVIATLAAPSALADAILKSSVSIDGDVVRLGDLFDNIAPEKAAIAVARAPLPGRRAVVDADWLHRAASANGVAWRPANVFEQVVVERSGATVTREQIEAEITTALAGQDLPANVEIELANRGAQMVVPAGSATSIGVKDLSYDSRYKRFTATIEVPADTAGAQRMRVSGRVFSTIDVPVLARTLGRGEIIGARDLTWQRAREDGLRRDIIVDADQIIGLTPRQSLRNGQMISANDVQKPLAVARGALVTMILRSGTMSLTAQGRAIEQGSVGDIVRITNTHSNLTVEGKVEGPNIVSIMPNGGLALAN